MKPQRQAVFWAFLAASLLFLLWLLWSVALPFIAALVIAYLLDPLARRLQRLGLSRLWATTLIIACFALVLAFILVFGIPALAHQIAALVSRLPSDVMRFQTFLINQLAPILERVGSSDLMPQIQKYLSEFAGQAASWLAKFLPSLVSGGQAIVSFLSVVVITPVVVFYLLMDWRKLELWINANLPHPYRVTIWQLGREISVAIDGFLRGQVLVCVFLGFIYAFGLWLVGLNSGITIGLIAGLISFIPYVGSLTGLVLALGVAIGQFWPDWTMILATLSVFLVGQFIEGNILSPRLVGQAIGLHPVWLMFALFAFGSLFGFGGLLIAAPMAAIIGVFVKFSLKKYQKSVYFTGDVKQSDVLESRKDA